MTTGNVLSNPFKKKRLNLLAGVALATALGGAAVARPLEAGATVAATPASTPVHFEIFLPLRDKDGLEALMRAQQTPGAKEFHQWLTPAQFAARFGPTSATMAAAKAAAASAGLTVTETHSRGFHVSGDAAHVNAFLHTTLNTITRADGQTRTVASRQPTPPAALAGARVLAFTPMPQRRPTAVRGPLAVAPDNRYTATGSYWFDDDKQAYSYPSYLTMAGKKPELSNGAGVHVAILMSDLLFPGDLEAAFNHEKFNAVSKRPSPKVSTVLVDGGGAYGGGGSFEASLDVQQVTGGAPGSAVTLVSIPDLSDQSIADGYTYIVESNSYDIVNSSFGGCELEYTAAYNGGTDYTYILQMLHEIFAQGNVQGTTFSASSGDNGGVMCPGPDYAPGVSSTFGLGVSSPADDTYVTAVGGGNLVTSVGPGLNSTYVRESAYGDPEYPYDIYGEGGGATVSGGYWGAGGGISSIFPRPAYQTLVNTGSTTWRTVPDVGMQVGGLGFSMLNGRDPGFCDGNAISCSADDSSVLTAYGVHEGGGFYFTIGTSVSSPEFVGALALYEQHAGRQGNVNPFLYKAGAAQTAAGGVTAPPAKQYFHRGMQGFDGYYAGGFPTANYDYIYGNGSPDVVNLFGLNAYGLAGTPQTISNP
jgi:subtilase family serine protease